MKMMTSEPLRPSSKLTHAPQPPMQYATLNALQSTIPLNPPLTKSILKHSPLIKDLRQINVLNELYPFYESQAHVQETVEIIPQPVSYERFFHSYIDDHTDLRSREYIKLDQGVYIRSNHEGQFYSDENMTTLFHNIEYNHRFKLDFYSSTLYIFPKQRNEKFISEIRYIPEHITIRYKTTLDLLSSNEHFYENIQDVYQISKDIFYRI
ncbi:hypothetical protein I4U23_028322 [Adineta vaga]|nr:hypothetical protein I4U23_028322 [Adineta vaga]